MKSLAIIAGASAYKLTQTPTQPVCVYVDKATGVERDCSAPGNSAWMDSVPYVGIEQNPEYHRNFFANFYFMQRGTGNQGYDVSNEHPDLIQEIPTIDYRSDSQFVGVNVSQQRDKFAVKVNGVMDIKESGEYTFYTKSDDGSRLWVDGEVIVDNWGLHGVREKSGKIVLHQGVHSINVDFFENFGGAYLTAEYSGPDTKGEKALVEGWHKEVLEGE